MNTFHYSALKRHTRQLFIAAIGSAVLSGCSSEPVPVLLAANPAQSTNSVLTQAPDEPSISADLSNDALIPPLEPSLKIEAMPGELVLSWTAHEGTEDVSIYHYDASMGAEQKLDLAIDPTSTQLYLPSKTHLRAWHRDQFRIELCTYRECVSSRRVAIMGLAGKTVTHLKPAVLIKNERYGEDIAINDTASVLTVSRPLEGSIDIHIKSDNDWVLTQRLGLSELPLSTTRKLHLTLSGSGDVMAALVTDPSIPDHVEIRMIERLGEAWIETQQLQLTAREQTDDVALQLSAAGDRLLLRVNNTISLFVHGLAGWQLMEPQIVTLSPTHSSAPVPSANLSDDYSLAMRLLAVSASASLHRLFTLHEKEQQLWVIAWQESSDNNAPSVWIPGTPLLISGLEATRDISLRSDDQGDKIVVAGWEKAGLAARTPVMWRFNVHSAESTLISTRINPTHSLSVIDSLRLAPTQNTQASLKLASDSNLGTVVIGWQSGESSDTGSLQDAQLFSYRYHAPTRQWLTALELPEAISTLAKRAFAGNVRLSANGRALVLGPHSSNAQQPDSGSNEVLVLH